MLQLEHLTYDESKGYRVTAEKIFKAIGKILGKHLFCLSMEKLS